MIIYPNGMVFWAQPIGRVHPYTVNVTSTSLTGKCVISWNLTIKPVYIPVITKVESADDSNMKMIKGIVNHNAKVGSVSNTNYYNEEKLENIIKHYFFEIVKRDMNMCCCLLRKYCGSWEEVCLIILW